MTEQVTLSEAARRLKVTRAAVSRWAATADDFPAVTHRGRALLVSWPAVERWHAARVANQDARSQKAAADARVRGLRGVLWRELNSLIGGRDAGMVLYTAWTERALRQIAKRWRIPLPP